MNRQEYHSAVKDYSGRLYRFVFKCLRNEEDAHDIVQDSYAKLWQNRKNVEWEKCRSWLFTVAYHSLLNLLKTKNRMEFTDEYGKYEPYVEESRMELKEVVDHCLELLPPIQKSVLLLRDLEGYDYAEIGKILNLSESQVKVYLFRARTKIKNHLKDLSVLA
ncbi:MAG: RNA polymerase sigma factor [Bacteroidota bacterium]